MIGGYGNFQGPELLAAPGIFQGGVEISRSWKFPGPLEISRILDISRPPGKFQGGPYIRSDTLCMGTEGQCRTIAFFKKVLHLPGRYQMNEVILSTVTTVEALCAGASHGPLIIAVPLFHERFRLSQHFFFSAIKQIKRF